jgi:hypothetical protein
MSVDVDGKLPGSVYVGRDDVASLATLAAVSDLNPQVKRRQGHSVNGTMISNGVRRAGRRSKQKRTDLNPIHWKVAVGWTGQKRNGHVNAEKCMEFIVKEKGRRKKSERRKQAIRNASPISRMLIQPYQRLIQRFRQRTVKPYGLFVFLPMLLVVYPTIISAMIGVCEQIPILHKAMLYILSLLQPTLQPLRDNAAVSLQKFLRKMPVARMKVLSEVPPVRVHVLIN